MTKLRWKIAQFAEIRWWQNYLRSRPLDAYLQWKRAYWEDFLEKIKVYPQEGDQVLDAGCGPAGIFIVLSRQHVDAVDPLIERYESNLGHFRKADYPYTTFFSMPLEDFHPVKSYDLIFCLNAINHVEDMEKCVDRLADCVKPGGKLIVSIDAHNHQFFKRAFRLLQVDTLHPHQYDLREYRQKMEARGLRVLDEVLFQKRFLFNYYALVCCKAV